MKPQNVKFGMSASPIFSKNCRICEYDNVGKCQLNAYVSVDVCDPVHEISVEGSKNLT